MEKEIKWKGVSYAYYSPECYSGEPLPQIDFSVHKIAIILGSTTNRTLAEVPDNAVVVGMRLLEEDKRLLEEACATFNKVLVDGMGNPYNQ